MSNIVRTLIDIEVTSLPFDSYLGKSQGRLMSYQELISNFKYAEIYQIGIKKLGSADAIKHYSVGVSSNASIRFNEGTRHRQHWKTEGHPLESIRGLVVTGNKQDQEALLEESLKGIHRYKAKTFKSATKKDYLNIFVNSEGKKVIASDFSTLALIGSGELDVAATIAATTKTAKLLKENYKDIDYKGLTQEQFTHSKEEGSLYKIIDDLVSPTRSGEISKFVGWNPYFDLNNLRAAALKYGHIDILKELDTAIKNGSFVVEGAEKYWQALIYKLSQENPALAENFKIFGNIDAFIETKGRVGRTPKNWNEFQYAIPWKAESVSNILKFDKRIAEAIPLGKELHIGSADVKLEEKMFSILEEIFSDIKGELLTKGIDIQNIDDLIGVETNGVVRKVLEAKILAGSADLAGASQINNLKDFEKELVSLLEKSNKYTKTLPLQAVGNSILKKNMNKVVGVDFNIFAKKYGTLALGTAVTSYLLHSVFSDEEESYFPFKGRIRANLRDTSTLNRIKTERMFEGEYNNPTGILRTLGSGLILPVASMFGLGAISAISDPRLFGRSTFNIPKDFKSAAEEFLRTTRYGVLKAEASVPLLRTLRITPTLNMMFGGFKTYDYSPDNLLGRSINIDTINKGKITGVFNHNKDISKLRFGVEELYKSGDISDEAWSIYKEVMHPESVPENVYKRSIKIGHKDGKSIIYFEDVTKTGERLAINGKNSLELPVLIDEGEARYVNVKNSDLLYRKHQRALAKEKGYNFTSKSGSIPDSFVHLEVQENAILYRNMRKKTFEEYLEDTKTFMRKTGQNIPKNGWEKAWEGWQKVKWLLDLDAKGVGETANNLFKDMEDHTSSVKSVLRIRRAGNIKFPIYEYTAGGMNTFFENPLNLLFADQNKAAEIASRLMRSKNALSRVAGRGFKILEGLHLGLPSYNMNILSKVPVLNKVPGIKTLEYFANFGVKRVLPAMALWGGFQLVDKTWGAITFDKDGRSPLTKIPIKAFEYTSLAYSKISDITGFTKISKVQERVAPGSTSLGIFTPAASMVSAYFAGEIAYKYGPKSIRTVMDMGLNKFLNMRYVKKALTPNTFLGTKVGSPFERYAGWALKNPKSAIFSFMMLPVLPFIPGFLGSSKTYRERKAEYDGDKEVPIRKYRGWLLSSSAYEGGKPIQFRRHAFNLIKSDWENRGVVWPSYWRKALHEMSLGILNPYALEEYHKEAQPVYQSAQYGANIPLVGPIIASTIGKLIKPTINYHSTGEEAYSSLNIEGPYSITNKFDKHTLNIARGRSSDELATSIGLEPEGGIGQLHSRLSKHYRDMIGFRGFLYEATKGAITGKKSSDQFVPYAQDATEMYNPAQSMWGYSLGDVTVFGGELLRRIYPMPSKIWRVNDIPNELFGVSWIPQDQTTGSPKDLTHGTTFDKIQMGWLYGSRKGWEFLYPEVKGLDLEQYPDPIRLEILQSIAPFSKEFNVTASQVLKSAISDRLDPEEEQRYYETMDQVRQLKDQIYAHSSEHAYRVSTEATRGIVTSVREDGGFTLDAFGSKTFRLAGVSLSEQDIRANLLAKKQFESTEALAEEARAIQESAKQLIQDTLYQGASVKIQTPEYDQISDANSGTEAIIGDLNEKLIDMGIPFSNTGNLSRYNMAQDRTGGIASRAMAKYWDSITSGGTFWGQKLIPKQDYLDQYLYKQVFNREVKLWNHPIEQILKPALATMLHRVGVDTVPDFTVERRRNQEYWDIIKYIKYKMLAVKASEDGDNELASYYHSKWRATMIGSNPTDDDTRDEMTALPANERAYYTRFASEPDPKKRGKIYKYLPRSAKRIYEATWLKKEAEMSDDPDIQRRWQDMLDSEGFDITPAERRLYEKEKVGDMTIADWIRTRLIQAYAQKNPIPGPQWAGWSSDISEENVELLALKEGGANIEDYGFFDERARMAAYDSGAYTAAIDVHTLNRTNTQALGRILPVIAANDYVEDAQGLPTKSIQPIMNLNVRTNGYDKQVAYEKHGILANIDDALGLLVNPFI